MLTIKDVAKKHGISKQAIIKKCPLGYFEIAGIGYDAVNVAKPGSRNARWELNFADKRRTFCGSIMKDLRMEATVVKIQSETGLIENQLKETKMRTFHLWSESLREKLKECASEYAGKIEKLGLPAETTAAINLAFTEHILKAPDIINARLQAVVWG